MTKRIAITLLFVAAGLFVKAQGKGSICIKVVEIFGASDPLPKVLLTLYNGKTKVASGLTDSKGDYCFNKLKPGTYRIVSKLKGYARGEMKDIILEENSMITGKIKTTTCVNGDH